MLGIPERLFVLGGMWLSGLAVIGMGAYLLLRQMVYLDPTTRGVVDIQVPWFGRLKTNYPAIAFLFFGAAIIWYPVHRYPFDAPPTIPIAGRITAKNGQGLALVPVSIISGSHRTFTDSNGNYSLNVVRQEGEQYWAVSFIAHGNKIEQFDMGSVSLDPAIGRGVYNHIFTGDVR